MLLKSEDDHFTAGNVVKCLMHLIIFVQSSEFHQGKTYIHIPRFLQRSTYRSFIKSKKSSIDFQIKISKILLKMAKINCPICQEGRPFPFETQNKGKDFRYFMKNNSPRKFIKVQVKVIFL